MKHLLCFFLACLFANLLSAQIPAALQNLEGGWYRDSRDQPVYSRWFQSDANTLLNHTFTLICKDTVLLSRAEIRFDQQTARLSMWADSVPGGQPQTYRLVRAGADELFWENEQEYQAPQRLSWLFFGANYLTFRADGVETDYRRARVQNVHPQLRLLTGIKWSNRNAYPASILPDQTTKLHFQSKPRFETAIGFGLSGSASPLSAYVELGYSQKELEVFSVIDREEVRYIRKGTYVFSNVTLGFVPELNFGPRRAFTVSTGIFFNLVAHATFDGVVKVSGGGLVNPTYAEPVYKKSPESGILAGIAYELPVARASAFHPSVYVRGLFDLGSWTRMAVLSAGLRFQIGQR